MTFEICTDSFDSIALAKAYGVKRIELCSALTVGGLTPSPGLIEICATQNEVQVHAMIRHIEGGFQYSDADIEIMKRDISMVKACGGYGVVFGCLNEFNEIEIDQNRQLANHAKSLGLEVTFHRAFDFCKSPADSIEVLIELGFDRLLTSGQQPTAIEGIDLIAELVRVAARRIEVMAGSGVNASNAETLAATGVDALHFTSHTRINPQKDLGMGSANQTNPNKARAITELFSI